MSGISDNPFVGPRPLVPGDPLYGRKGELRELYNRLQARRIVVLHSPSGAGKSSLVQAGLIPRLKGAKFDVWKPIRVNLDPAGLEDVPPDTNRYLLSALISLEDELPAKHRRSPVELARLDFLEYLDERPRRKSMQGRSVVLLFDQFEEVLTVDPLADHAKHEFFAAIGRALNTERYWALFIIRDDYLGGLAPFREHIPTQLSNTYRLELFSLDSARETAVGLAEEGGRSFPAVDKLVRDLAIMQVQQPDGSFVAERGVHVEPVYLQVVCHRLWDALPPETRSIELGDLDNHASISDSLAGYYDDAIAAIAQDARAVERELREWVGSQLIVGGIRSQVRQGLQVSAGLLNEHIEKLLAAYIVRMEQRAGSYWFELSHDRLIEPVSTSNQLWEADNLHPTQVQTKLWLRGGRARALLLPVEALPDAQRWALQHPELVTVEEHEFLRLSQVVRTEEARQRRYQKIFTLSLAGVALVALAFGGLAWRARLGAEEERHQALAAKEEAETARSAALAAQQSAEHERNEAEHARTEAEHAQRRAHYAEQAQQELVRELLVQMFDIAFAPMVQELAAAGVIPGALEASEEWTHLLTSGSSAAPFFAAATVLEQGGRLIVIAYPEILELPAKQRARFLEVTTRWLLADQGGREVALISGQADHHYERLEGARRSLEKLGYTVEVNPELSTLDDDDQIGIIIVDDMAWRSFTPAELASAERFVRRGGGLLGVGMGKAWLERDTTSDSAAPLPTLDAYPMNQLLANFGARWTEALVIAQSDEQASRESVALFENLYDEVVNLFKREGEDELFHSSVAPEQQSKLLTERASEWVVRSDSDNHKLGEVTISSPRDRVQISAEGVERSAAPLPKAAPLPIATPTAQLRTRRSKAERVALACGERHGTYFSSVKIKLRINGAGVVTQATLLTRERTSVGRCVVKELTQLEFPKSRTGAVSIWTLPLRKS